MKPHMRSFLVRLAVPLLVLSMLAVFTSGTALAASTPSKNHLLHITVHMHVVNHTSPAGNVPQGTTFGNCGTIEFYVDDYGYGEANFWMLVSSDLGSINSLAYSWSWHNWSSGSGVGYSRTLANPANPWSQDPTLYTGTGYVTGAISATDVTGGTTCYGSESDGNTIT